MDIAEKGGREQGRLIMVKDEISLAEIRRREKLKAILERENAKDTLQVHVRRAGTVRAEIIGQNILPTSGLYSLSM